MLLRADLMCSVTKPQSTSFLGRLLYAIDIFLSLSSRTVLEIEFELLAIEPRMVGWIDDNFVGIIVFSDNVDYPI